MKFLKITEALSNHVYLGCKEKCGAEKCTHKVALFWATSGIKRVVHDHVPLTTINGYKFYRFNSGFVSVHKMVWYLIFQGFKPGHHIDHIDGNRGNFQPENLREITVQENMLNRRKPRRDGAQVLPKGVQSTPSGKYKASISIEGKTKHLGTFGTPELAHAAWREAAIAQHGEFFCDRL